MKQPNAITVAKRLEREGDAHAAKEIRRLHEANQELIEALKICKNEAGVPGTVWKTARSAIAKGEQQ